MKKIQANVQIGNIHLRSRNYIKARPQVWNNHHISLCNFFLLLWIVLPLHNKAERCIANVETAHTTKVLERVLKTLKLWRKLRNLMRQKLKSHCMLFKYISLRWKALFHVCWLVTSEVISKCYSPLSSQRGKHVKNLISDHFSLQWLTEKTNHFIHIIRSHVIGYIAPEDDQNFGLICSFSYLD